MKKEYDFSQGTRGKFYHPDSELKIPIYLEPDVMEFLHQVAKTKNITIEALVNAWLRQDIDILQERATISP